MVKKPDLCSKSNFIEIRQTVAGTSRLAIFKMVAIRHRGFFRS